MEVTKGLLIIPMGNTPTDMKVINDATDMFFSQPALLSNEAVCQSSYSVFYQFYRWTTLKGTYAVREECTWLRSRCSVTDSTSIDISLRDGVHRVARELFTH